MTRWMTIAIVSLTALMAATWTAVRPINRAAAQSPPAPTVLQHVTDAPTGAAGELYRPTGMAAGPDGSVYVADPYNYRIQQFDRDGVFLRTWGVPGTGQGQFSSTDIALIAASNGTVYAVTSGSTQVQRFTADGKFIDAWSADHMAPGRLGTVKDAAFGPGGEMYVLDSDCRITAFDAAGRFLTSWGRNGLSEGEFKVPRGIAVDSDGTIFVADTYNNRIQTFGPDGVFRMAWGKQGSAEGELNRPTGVAPLGDGTLLISSMQDNQVQQFTTDGQWIASWAKPSEEAGQLNVPIALSIGPDDAVFVLDTIENYVKRFSLDGEFQSAWGTHDALADRMLHTVSADVSANGEIFLLHGQLPARVYQFDSAGRLANAWGEEGSGSGQLSRSASGTLRIAPDGSVLLSLGSATNGYIQAFATDGTLLREWSGVQPFTLASNGDVLSLASSSSVGKPKHPFQRTDSEGNLIGQWGIWGRFYSGGFAYPAAIAATADDTIGVLDLGRLQVFDAEGNWLQEYGATWLNCGSDDPPWGKAYDMRLGPDGLVYVPNRGHELLRFGSDWHMVDSLSLVRPGSGRLNTFAHTPDGRLVVVRGHPFALSVYGTEPPDGWRLALHDNRWMARWPVDITDGATLPLEWSEPPTVVGAQSDGWSGHASRMFDLAGGQHTFSVSAQSGVRLWVNDRLLVDQWDDAGIQTEASVWLPAGRHWVRLAFNHFYGPASVGLEMSRVDAPSPTPSRTFVVPPTHTPTLTPTREPSPTPTQGMVPTYRPAGAHRLHLPIAHAFGADASVAPNPPYLGNPDIDVQHYAIQLVAPEMGRADIRAEAEIRLRAVESIAHVMLDFEPGSANVHEILVDGEAVHWGWLPGNSNQHGLTGSRLSVPVGDRLPIGGEVTVTVRYDLDHTSFRSGYGLTCSVNCDRDDLAALSAPYFARFWFPSNDTPTDPATVSYELHVPEGIVAAGNGGLVAGDYETGSYTDGQGLRVFEWSEEVPIPTYLFTVLLMRGDVYVDELCFNTDTVNSDRVDCAVAQHRLPLLYYGTDGSNKDLLAHMEVAAKAVIFYSSALGVYPFEKIAYTGARAHWKMEYASLTHIGGDESTWIHETVHHWWGNSVYVPHWGEFWMKEGFTQYFTYYWEDFTRKGADSAICGCGGAFRLRKSPATDIKSLIDSAFSSSTLQEYCGGAGAAHDLNVRINHVVGLPYHAEPAKTLYLHVISDLYQSFRFRHMGADDIAQHMRDNLVRLYAEKGYSVEQATVDAIVDTWLANWFGG